MNEEKERKTYWIVELCREKPYLVIAISLMIAHMILEVMYLTFGCWFISCVNVISIAIYAFMIIFYGRLSRIWHIRIIFWEVIAFSIFAIALYGDASCYSINIIPLIPILCYWDYESKYVHKDRSWDTQRRWATICIAIVFVIEQIMDGLNFHMNYPISAQEDMIICLFNFATLFTGILIGTLMWWNLTDFTAGLLAESLAEADYLAKHDPLTGLRNRKSLDEHVKWLEQNNKEYAFIIADIDNFKSFNDTYGHDCGDEILRKISGTVRRRVRDGDLVCRWGGEEIVIIMPDVHRKLAEQRAVDICRAVSEEKFLYSGNKFSVTVTLGVTVSQGRVANEVMKEADQFLFWGKENGKNCAVGTGGKIPGDRE